jgi:hypothetical protein
MLRLLTPSVISHADLANESLCTRLLLFWLGFMRIRLLAGGCIGEGHFFLVKAGEGLFFAKWWRG